MKNSEQPAFPNTGCCDETDCGLSKREYFAAKAMQGLLANQYTNGASTYPDVKEVSTISIKYADDLLAELEKESSTQSNPQQ